MTSKGISPQQDHMYFMSVTGFVNSLLLQDMKLLSRKRGSDKSEQREEEE